MLEHIGDVRGAVIKASVMLDERGVIYWYQGGSGRSLDMVLNEPHYRLPGLTILPRELAIDILMRAGKIPNPQKYVVAWWPRLPDIAAAEAVRIFAHDGAVNLRNGVPIAEAKTVVEKARAQVPGIAERLKDYLTVEQLDQVRTVIATYLDELLAAAADQRRFKFEYASQSCELASLEG